eukprot:13268544-Alexandrium_andersonii.AAC.1
MVWDRKKLAICKGVLDDTSTECRPNRVAKRTDRIDDTSTRMCRTFQTCFKRSKPELRGPGNDLKQKAGPRSSR